ncbi:hypothetical protein EV191_108131 [Tamaricihabitans halophyticus]|uniref:DUF5666 domain-containing protein n=1 Tax=Tamaricihabitans halophyticus TaxID=1262583 RepID=A0A4R2QMG5_9PSEU|nr:hypothetical protein [Tamaricihabitans halophyticus]TCP50044.1 hypothetical protein EV191_108131 [Tamaricihabitans halophyticus]
MTDNRGQTDQEPGADQPRPWGAPTETAPPPWSPRRTLTAIAIAAGIAVAGGTIIYLSSDESASAEQQRVGGRLGAQHVDPTLDAAVHGEYTVPDADGYRTEQLQRGEITELTATEFTVRSADGFQRTYQIDESGEAGFDPTHVSTGDSVMVVADVDGETATARTVTDDGADGDQRSGPGRGGPGGTGPDGRPGDR